MNDTTREASAAQNSSLNAGNGLWDNLMIDVRAEFEPTKMPLRQLKQISEGLVVEVSDLVQNQVRLHVDGRTVANGELVVVGDKFGVLITEIPKVVPPPPAEAYPKTTMTSAISAAGVTKPENPGTGAAIAAPAEAPAEAAEAPGAKKPPAGAAPARPAAPAAAAKPGAPAARPGARPAGAAASPAGAKLGAAGAKPGAPAAKPPAAANKDLMGEVDKALSDDLDDN